MESSATAEEMRRRDDQTVKIFIAKHPPTLSLVERCHNKLNENIYLPQQTDHAERRRFDIFLFYYNSAINNQHKNKEHITTRFSFLIALGFELSAVDIFCRLRIFLLLDRHLYRLPVLRIALLCKIKTVYEYLTSLNC
jgi:hypothetical protein